MTGQGYDAIVIVAHSQGAVVTADLLRFLALEPDPHLRRLEGEFSHARMPVYLFTIKVARCDSSTARAFGACARGQRTTIGRRWPVDTGRRLAVPPRVSVAPEPAALRVEKWVNACRSGDYIGRYLWRTDPCGYVWTPDLSGSGPANSMDKNGRLEFCIGAGAPHALLGRRRATNCLERSTN